MLSEWNQEWGRLDTEGNIWWMGNARREWEAVMGKNWLGWIRKSSLRPSMFDCIDLHLVFSFVQCQ